MKVNKSMVFSNLIWRFAERVGAQGVSLIVSILLARLLTPDDYGKVALMSVFISVFTVFVNSGLGTALIQKKDTDEHDFTTVFYFNIVWCIILYIILYLIAPLIAKFYQELDLASLIRVSGITILISSIKNVQHAYVSRTMQFKKFFVATLGGTIFSGIIGIFLAYKGKGAWALVAQSLSNTAIDTIALWFTVKWRPTGIFYFERLKKLYSFGWKILISSLLNTIYNNLRSLIIGKKYTSEDLAFYNKAKVWPDLVVSNLLTAIDSVLMPSMSLEQDNRKRMKLMTRKAISISSFVIAPMMIGLFCVAPSLVSLLLTDKWLSSVPYIRIFCITYMFYPIHTANLNAIKALGRSDLFLKLEIKKKIFGIIVLFLTMWHGPLVMAYSTIIISFYSQVVNSRPNKELLRYSYFEQMKDVLPNMLLASFMGICVSLISMLNLPAFVTLAIQVMVGTLVYVTVAIISKNENCFYIWSIIKPLIGRLIVKKR